jgi:hypothetical protein
VLDLLAVHLLLEEALELRDEFLAAALLVRIGLGLRVDEVELERAEEQLLHEGRRFPCGLARGFCDGARLLLGGVRGGSGGFAHRSWLRVVGARPCARPVRWLSAGTGPQVTAPARPGSNARPRRASALETPRGRT